MCIKLWRDKAHADIKSWLFSMTEVWFAFPFLALTFPFLSSSPYCPFDTAQAKVTKMALDGGQALRTFSVHTGAGKGQGWKCT